MKPRCVAISLLALAASLWAGEVQAQARRAVPQASKKVEETLDSAARAKKLAELDAWLRSLAGNFRVTGDLYDQGRIYIPGAPYESRNNAQVTDVDAPESSNPKGRMQCQSIGPGPGIHCLVNVTWGSAVKTIGHKGEVFGFSEAYNTLHPAMALWALDPDKLEVQLMLVDDQGNANTWSGPLTGDTVNLDESRFRCWGGDTHQAWHCPRRIEITARPGSDLVKLEMRELRNAGTTAYYIDLKLHRLPDDKKDGTSK